MFKNYINSLFSKKLQFLNFANKIGISLKDANCIKQNKNFYVLYNNLDKVFSLKTKDFYLLEDNDICSKMMSDRGLVSIADKIITEICDFFNMMDMLNGKVDNINKSSKLYYVENKNVNFIFETIKFSFSRDDNPYCLTETSFNVVYFAPNQFLFGRVSYGNVIVQTGGPYYDDTILSKDVIFDKMNDSRIFIIMAENTNSPYCPEYHTTQEDYILNKLKTTYLGRKFPSWEQVGIPNTQEDADLIKMLSY